MVIGIYFPFYKQFEDIKLVDYGGCSTFKKRRKKKSEEWGKSALKPVALESKDCLGTPFVYLQINFECLNSWGRGRGRSVSLVTSSEVCIRSH